MRDYLKDNWKTWYKQFCTYSRHHNALVLHENELCFVYGWVKTKECITEASVQTKSTNALTVGAEYAPPSLLSKFKVEVKASLKKKGDVHWGQWHPGSGTQGDEQAIFINCFHVTLADRIVR